MTFVWRGSPSLLKEIRCWYDLRGHRKVFAPCGFGSCLMSEKGIGPNVLPKCGDK